MQHSEQLNELAAALARAQATMRPAVKDSANPFFKSKYADLQSVVEAATAALSAHGLSVSSLTDADEAGNMTLCTYLLHASGQWMCSRYPIVPVKQDPQGIGSAISYARRYALMSIVNLATSDDDGEAAMGRSDDRQTQVPPSRRAQHNQRPEQLPEAWGGRKPAQSAKRKHLQHPRDAADQHEPDTMAGIGPEPTSELFQDVMAAIRDAGGQDDLTAAWALAAGLTNNQEHADMKAAWVLRRAVLAGAAERSDAARGSIKAALTLPKPA